ncbi:flagellar hook-length control protein FliK [Candidatus Saganbacteria bacterium]|nr:flagellar hook-length control protein FliK [Candidatus Saganbacteria bacterium]
MSNPVTSATIDQTSLQGTAITPQRHGDGTFDNYLDLALAQLDSLFVPLKFEFDFSSEKTEEPAPPPKEEKTTYDDPNTLATPHSELRNEKLEALETKAIKQALIANLPTFIPFAPLPLAASPNSSAGLTKGDMQVLIDDLVERARIFKLSQKPELNLDLRSEELGRLLLSFKNRNGGIEVLIAAADGNSKKLLDEHILELENSLKAARITLNDLRVTEISKNKEEET